MSHPLASSPELAKSGLEKEHCGLQRNGLTKCQLVENSSRRLDLCSPDVCSDITTNSASGRGSARAFSPNAEHSLTLLQREKPKVIRGIKGASSLRSTVKS